MAPEPSPPTVPGFVVRGFIACVGVTAVVMDDTGGVLTVIGWGLVAIALAVEALASIVYLRRRPADAGRRVDDGAPPIAKPSTKDRARSSE
jgi:hypothetical protein